MTYSVVVYALVGDEGSRLLQFFSIAKTQFLNLAPFIENIKHKSSSSSTIYKTSDSSRKMKHSPQNSFTCVQNQTLLSNHKQCNQNDIHYQAVSKQYTKKIENTLFKTYSSQGEVNFESQNKFNVFVIVF